VGPEQGAPDRHAPPPVTKWHTGHIQCERFLPAASSWRTCAKTGSCAVTKRSRSYSSAIAHLSDSCSILVVVVVAPVGVFVIVIVVRQP
jgi:hypothetical protein